MSDKGNYSQDQGDPCFGRALVKTGTGTVLGIAIALFLWFRRALVKTGTGTVLGIATALFLVAASELFPELEDFDYDIGLQLRRSANELWHRSTSLPRQKPGDEYVFLDVDPDILRSETPYANNELLSTKGTSSMLPCEALACKFPDLYSMEGSGTSVCIKQQALSATTGLNCSPARPLNRYLLGQLVKELRKRQARIIVIDIVLEKEPGIISPEEDKALLRLLEQSHSNSAIPVVYVKPADYAWQERGLTYIYANALDVFADVFERNAEDKLGVWAAVGLPSPGQPLRRYPKCYKTDRQGLEALPSIPFITAHLMGANAVRLDDLCAIGRTKRVSDKFAAPRIFFTLPTLHRIHLDAAMEGEDFRTFAIYKHIYNRCLASNFWDDKLACGKRETYQHKVVVIGASNHLRRDQHSTPLGNMVGAEVVINAIRSFTHPELANQIADRAFWSRGLKKIAIVLWCAPIWLAYYLIKCAFFPEHHKWSALSRSRKIAGVIAVPIAFFVVVILVITITVMYASFAVVVGVLAIAVDQYVEIMRKVIFVCDSFLRWCLRLPNHGELR